MLKPNQIYMNVHSATCSCSVELYKQWYTLADFLPNWDFRGVLHIINLAVRISAVVMAGDIMYTFFYILFARKNSAAAIGGPWGGGGGSFYFLGCRIA